MADTLLGQVLDGRYRLAEVLSDAGPHGVVYRAEHLRLERTFRVKVFRQGGPSFEAEARKLSCIRHPNIEAIHDYGRLPDGRPYLVTEMQSGESLADRMERPIDQLEVVAILKDACAGLAAVHAADLVHGSIKPENVFWSDGQLHLTDFDLPALRGSSSFIDEAALASAEWTSPEQAKGLSPEPASDLYSLGAIAYACLAGHPPHQGEPHLVLSKKIDAEATPLSELGHPIEVDQEVAALIALMTAREAFDRPSASSAAELTESLHAGLIMPPLLEPVRPRIPWFGLVATLMGAAALIVAEMRVASLAPRAMLPAIGRVTLESEPSGAHIYLDGEPLLTFDGELAVTPADVQSLIYGQRYRVQLRKSGYVNWETEVEMSRTIDGRSYRTELAPHPAVLWVTAAPRSLIFIDEVAVGRGPTIRETVDPTRPHLIRATSADSECEEQMVHTRPGAVTHVELACTPSYPQRGEPVKLTVTGNSDADVYLDQHWIGSPRWRKRSLRGTIVSPSRATARFGRLSSKPSRATRSATTSTRGSRGRAALPAASARRRPSRPLRRGSPSGRTGSR